MLTWLALVAAAPSQTPTAFIQQVYAEYRHQGFSPLARPEKFFSSTLAAAIRKDGSDGEVGYLDGDPLCDCQDYDRISASVRSLSRPSPRTASARVHVLLAPREARDLRLSLVMTRSGWRIADVVGPDRQSLLRELQRSNAARFSHRRSVRHRK